MKFFWKYYLWSVNNKFLEDDVMIRTTKKAFYLDPGDIVIYDDIEYQITGKKEIVPKYKEVYIYVKEK